MTHGAKMNAQLVTGRTALYNAVAYQNMEMVALLISHGADVNIVDSEGKQPRILLGNGEKMKFLTCSKSTNPPFRCGDSY